MLSGVPIPYSLQLDFLEIALFVDRLTIRIGLGVFQTNRLLADGTHDRRGPSENPREERFFWE